MIKKDYRQRSKLPEGSHTSVQQGTPAGLSSVFGMGTGVAPPLWPPKDFLYSVMDDKLS